MRRTTHTFPIDLEWDSTSLLDFRIRSVPYLFLRSGAILSERKVGGCTGKTKNAFPLPRSEKQARGCFTPPFVLRGRTGLDRGNNRKITGNTNNTNRK